MATKKCPVCGEESKALHLHMKKHEKDLPIDDPRSDDKVNKLEKMMGDLVGVVSSLTEKVDKLTPKTEWQVKQKPADNMIKKIEDRVDAQANETSFVSPKIRALVDEILGSDFGISVSYPDSGNGFQFSIVVPLDKSNAPKDYLEYYKSDVRTKTLGNAEGLEGIRKYCELVKKNLTIRH